MPEYRNETETSREIGLRELRAEVGTVAMDVGVGRKITYVMHRGRRIAGLVPLDVAEAAEQRISEPGGDSSA